MFRRNAPTPPPGTPPPSLPTGIRLPAPGVTPTRSTAPSPSTLTPPRSGTSLSRPDTPQLPIAFGPDPFYLHLPDLDNSDTNRADSDNMEWAGTPRPSSPPAQAASTPLSPSAASNQIDSMSATQSNPIIPILHLMPSRPWTRNEIREDLIHRLTSLINYPTPPTYALLQRRISEIRTVAITLTLFANRTPPEELTPDNTPPTSLDNLVLEEYRTYLANEAATQQQVRESTPDSGLTASNDEAVGRAMAHFNTLLRSMRSEGGSISFTASVLAAREAVSSMLPGGPAWARDEAGSTVDWNPSQDAAAAARSRERQEAARERFEELRNAGPSYWGDGVPQGAQLSPGSGFIRRERLDDSDSSTASGTSQRAAESEAGDGPDLGILGLLGGRPRAEYYRSRFPMATDEEIAEALIRREVFRPRRVARQTRNRDPRSAGVSTRVWPDARSMTAEQIAEFNRVARMEDREEDERIERQREEERRRVEEEEGRIAAVREQVTRRLRDAVEEEMRGAS
ncbi:hypothetical protein P167DRAFT_575970 [Morchella conica CCBAS932]|uniref:Uncharacterized protein n=1 Tax=Morchella conica CCBAS932 TaxID=1392247 RepID=A0A3N4KJC0_9PEZI|nr:hypothetical protein P167DRAFT_575970 [Morchella conica CCBAS932]